MTSLCDQARAGTAARSASAGGILTPVRSLAVPAIWAIVMMLTLGNVFGWLWFEDRTYTAELAATRKEMRLANSAFGEHTRRTLDELDTILRAVRQFYLTTASIKGTELFVDELARRNPLLKDIYLIDASGKLIITRNETTRGRNAAVRDFFQFHANSGSDTLHIGTVRTGTATGRQLLRITRRISNPDGSFGGVVLIALEPTVLSDFYRSVGSPHGATTRLVGTEDHIVRAATPEPAPEAWQTRLESPMWDILTRLPEATFQAGVEPGGPEHHFVYRRVSGWPLVVLSEFTESEVRKRVAVQMWPIRLAIAYSTLVLLALAGALTITYRQREHMRNLATTDMLTGVANRRHLMDTGCTEVMRAQRYGNPLSVLMLDVDKFKSVNDTFGHAAGDRVLAELATRIAAILRQSDIVGRLGGEEFAAILPQTSMKGAMRIAERIRTAVEQCSAVAAVNGDVIRFTTSIGVATLAPNENSFETVLERADAALYRAKSSGRNCVASA